MEKSLNQLAEEIYKISSDNGLHSKVQDEDTIIQRVCNDLHDEVCELHEAWKKNKLHEESDKSQKLKESGIGSLTNIEEEFADIVILALDFCKKLKKMYIILIGSFDTEIKDFKVGD
jgi:NTP pyrophosphatase (non-canonical NTP hydrolase)